jgi:LPS O-antigen subunit length determinant protein (WzzB/FepE family)
VNNRHKLDLDNNYPLDDIGFKKIVFTLWSGKNIIGIFFILSVAVGVIYSMYAQQWWTSSAEVVLPKFKDYSSLSEKSNKIISIVSDLNSNKEVKSLTNRNDLYDEFLLTFNSYDNKKTFLSKNKLFKEFLKNNDIVGEVETTKAYDLWIKNINSKQIKKDKNNYILTIKNITAVDSYNLLTDYINYTQNKNIKDTEYNISQIIKENKITINDVLQQAIFDAKQKLMVMKNKNNYALRIAESAGIDQPLSLYKDNSLFSISEGSKALKEKAIILSNFDDYNLIIPEIGYYKYKLKMLNEFKVNDDLRFKSYRFIQNVSYPLVKDAPNKKLIVILCAILGLIFGSFIVLLRSEINK